MEQNKIGMASATYLHQEAIRNILVNYFTATKYKNFEPIPDFAIDANDLAGSQRPDVLFYNKKGVCMVALELDNKKGIKVAATKSIEYLEDKSSVEAFTYNYDTKTWVRYGVNDEDEIFEETNESFSEVLQIDLDKLLVSPQKFKK